MSGRVRVTLPTGRRVIGFRKTEVERGPRTPAHLLPDWTLWFMLPEGTSVRTGFEHGIVGLKIEAIGAEQFVTVKAKSKPWAIDQAIKLMRRLGITRVKVRLTRPAEPGPTLSGPLRRSEDHVTELVADPYRAWAGGNGQMRLLA